MSNGRKVSVRALQEWFVQQVNAKKIVIVSDIDTFNKEFKTFVSENNKKSK